ncbi:MAG: hypothetical protein QM831_30685 [Kofleriaceae bacterium]
MKRPAIDPGVAAALTAQIPARLIKKLDAEPELAAKWTWKPTTVTTDKGETVTFELVDDVVKNVTCTCLLTPKCLHVAAVVALLEPAEASASDAEELDSSVEAAMDEESVTESSGSTEDPEPEPSADAGKSVAGASAAAGKSAAGGTGKSAPATAGKSAAGATGKSTSGATGKSASATGAGASSTASDSGANSEAIAVATTAYRVCATVLTTGAESSGAFVQAELLRSIHACRDVGLYRLASTQTRILRSIRDLRADRPTFILEVLTADLREACAVAYQLAHGTSNPALVGTARRDYESIGNLRLHGIFSEALVARSGYAGTITYLADDRGRIFTRSEVNAGDAGRAAATYEAPANIGDAVLSHRELGRAGLFVGDATASADGRLGAGQKVKAVRAKDPSTWAPLDKRFATPLSQQLASVAASEALADDHRPGGWDLVFVEGTVVGLGQLALLDLGGTALELATSLDHKSLVAHDNLATLGKTKGVKVRAIGRVRLAQPRRLELLAIAPAAGETRLIMSDAWHGRVNVHYDRLSTPSGGAPAGALAALASSPPDLLEPLRRRIERVVQGGAATLPTHALAEVERDAAQLTERALRTGADLLRDLAAVAQHRKSLDRERFATAWLRAAIYDDAARRRTSIASW